MEVFITVINLFGGLGLFLLWNEKMMGDGLENAAEDKLKGIFDRITSNPVKGVLTGAIVTANYIQSSSATTVMVVGFVNLRTYEFISSNCSYNGCQYRNNNYRNNL